MARPARSALTAALRSTVALAILGSLVAGCTSTGSLFGGPRSQRAAAAGPMDSGGLGVYLDLMQQLVADDAASRDAVFDAARDAAANAPTTTNRLRYALALSMPGHSGSDAAAAAEQLGELLAAPDTLLPQEQVLARIQLGQAEQRASLEARRDELAGRLETALADQDAENADQIRNLRTENAKLKAELEDANQMLDAITRIEESISERETDEN